MKYTEASKLVVQLEKRRHDPNYVTLQKPYQIWIRNGLSGLIAVGARAGAKKMKAPWLVKLAAGYFAGIITLCYQLDYRAKRDLCIKKGQLHRDKLTARRPDPLTATDEEIEKYEAALQINRRQSYKIEMKCYLAVVDKTVKAIQKDIGDTRLIKNPNKREKLKIKLKKELAFYAKKRKEIETGTRVIIR
jgi:hypothetical protein